MILILFNRMFFLTYIPGVFSDLIHSFRIQIGKDNRVLETCRKSKKFMILIFSSGAFPLLSKLPLQVNILEKGSFFVKTF